MMKSLQFQAISRRHIRAKVSEPTFSILYMGWAMIRLTLWCNVTFVYTQCYERTSKKKCKSYSLDTNKRYVVSIFNAKFSLSTVKTAFDSVAFIFFKNEKIQRYPTMQQFNFKTRYKQFMSKSSACIRSTDISINIIRSRLLYMIFERLY